ncbi:predicted protein [Postia placenta Mad-698-R]|nr:predicted protein [Postia placenta Mad-698-R]
MYKGTSKGLTSCILDMGSYKPNPKIYLSALTHLNLEPHQCAMVAAHIYDRRASATHGMKTMFVHQPREPNAPNDVKSNSSGGEVDVYVESFVDIANLLAEAKGATA